MPMPSSRSLLEQVQPSLAQKLVSTSTELFPTTTATTTAASTSSRNSNRTQRQSVRPPMASLTTMSSPAFKLRPRSIISHPLPPIEGGMSSSSLFVLPPPSPSSINVSTPTLSSSKPTIHGVHTISPDGPMHPSASASSRTKSPVPSLLSYPIPAAGPSPPSFTAFLKTSSGAVGTSTTLTSCSSPIKKQKTELADRSRLHLSPEASSPRSDNESPASTTSDENSYCEYYVHSALGTPPVTTTSSTIIMAGGSLSAAPMFPPLMKFPSTPSTGKRSLPTQDEDNSGSGPLTSSSASSSPFTPNGRAMLQNLCIHSPSTPTLSSTMSPTPGNSSSSATTSRLLLSRQVIYGQLPNMPTFSFSPSLKPFPNNNNNNITNNRSTGSTEPCVSSRSNTELLPRPLLSCTQ